MIAKAALWLLCTYLTLKLIQFVFGGRSGFRGDELTVGEKLRRGEPILFAIAFALSVPFALWTSWYVETGYTRAFAHSTDCYGKLRALDHLADVERRADPMKVYETIMGAQGAAFLSAQSLDLKPAVVNQALTDKMGFYASHYSTLSRQGDPRKIGVEIGAIERCLNEPAIEL